MVRGWQRCAARSHDAGEDAIRPAHMYSIAVDTWHALRQCTSRAFAWGLDWVCTGDAVH